ncbi:MAG: pilin [Pseudomonadales bacterium]
MTFLREIKRRKLHLVAAVSLTFIGIIAVISNMPADTFSRAQVSEGLMLSSEAKAAVTEYYVDHDQFPADNVTAGLPPATNIQGKYVSSIEIVTGEIVVTYGNDANSDIHGNTLIIQPEISGQSVTWVCFSLDIVPKNVPHACR